MILLIFAFSSGMAGLEVDYLFHHDIETFNNEFEQNGFPHRFDNNSWGWSWNASVVQNNILIGLQNLSGEQNEEIGDLSLDLTFSSRIYEIGYIVDIHYLYILFKVGGGYSNVHLKAFSISDSSTFFGVLSDPGESSNLTASSFSLSGAVGVLIPLSDYIGLQLTGGYIHGLSEPNWKFANGQELYEDPALDIKHTYIKAGFVITEFRKP